MGSQGVNTKERRQAGGEKIKGRIKNVERKKVDGGGGRVIVSRLNYSEMLITFMN